MDFPGLLQESKIITGKEVLLKTDDVINRIQFTNIIELSCIMTIYVTGKNGQICHLFSCLFFSIAFFTAGQRRFITRVVITANRAQCTFHRLGFTRIVLG